MKTKIRPEIHVHIGEATNVYLARDLGHIRTRRGDTVAVQIGKVCDSQIGGDVANVKTTGKRRKGKSKIMSRRGLKAIGQAAVAVVSLGGMVAASGIAYALGWS